MSAVTTFVGGYNEGQGSTANATFTANTTGALGMQEISGILKQIYDGQKLATLYYKNNPMYSMLRKKTDFYGETYPLPCMLETPTGVSNVFANAQLVNQLANGGSGTAGNLGPAKFVKFFLTRAKLYGVHVIDREAMLAASQNIGAFVNGQMAQMDAMVQATANLASQQLYRSGSGSIGQISTIGTGSANNGVIQLTNPTDARYFTVGQIVYATNKDPIQGATSVTQRTGVGLVVSLNRATGQVTVGDATAANTSTPQSPTAWTTLDFLQISGTSPLFGPSIGSNNLPVALSGLAAWVGQSQVIGSSDVFFGVNRSADTWRLAGGYYNGANNGQAVEEALYDASTNLFAEGGSPDMCFVGPLAYAALQKSCAARNIFQTDIEGPKDEAGNIMLYFKGIQIQGAGGTITVIADRNCQPYKAWLLTMADWALYSLKDFPHVVDDDGVTFLRKNSADEFEFRLAGYGNLGCSAPGHSMMVDLSV